MTTTRTTTKNGYTHRSDFEQKNYNKAVEYAKSRNGQCLSSHYIDSRTPMKWKCEVEEHAEWSAPYKSMVSLGRWCPECGKVANKNNEGLEKSKQHAISKGGECLSTDYKRNNDPLIWKCHNPNHLPWSANYNNVVSKDQWCTHCKKDEYEIEMIAECHKMANDRKGFFLGDSYINNKTNMPWKCSKLDHRVWYAASKRIAEGSWCPDCSAQLNISESRARMFLETYLGFKLPPQRPIWNINPLTMRTLELDGYNEYYKIAFEHDGEHHSKPFAYRDTEHLGMLHFVKQKIRDSVKRKNCEKRGITLINIPILPISKRYDFDEFLKHMTQCCNPHGMILSYTDRQLDDMRVNFYNL